MIFGFLAIHRVVRSGQQKLPLNAISQLTNRREELNKADFPRARATPLHGVEPSFIINQIEKRSWNNTRRDAKLFKKNYGRRI